MSVVNELLYLCRLCATKTEILLRLPIFDRRDENLRNIDKKIAACLPIQVSMTDELPKIVCEECAFKLDEIFDFRNKCLETEDFFMGMLKRMKDTMIHVDNSFQDSITEIPEIATIHNNISNINSKIVQNCTAAESTENSGCIDKSENIEASTIHTVQVIDEMNSAGVEQVVSQEPIDQQEDIEVTFIDCLDGDTVRMVDEHIREVSDHQIAMHLESDITVVGHLGMNDVSGIGSESPSQIVHYCNNVKYETVPVKEEYNQQIQKRLTIEVERRRISDSFDQIPTSNDRNNEINESPLSNAIIGTDTQENSDIPSTSRRTMKNFHLSTEYTKYKKHTLLESTLNNPTIDETGINWYICPICNEAATESNNLADHYDEHFFSCTCGLFFINSDQLNNHKEFSCKTKKVKRERPNSKNEKSKNQEVKNHESLNKETGSFNTDENKKLQVNGRQKWTPKICSQCGKQYRTNYKLQEHMRKHTGEKPFQCLLCDKAFRSKIGLAQHTATHTGQFDYSCSTCGKGFQCKSYLIVHQRVHSDLKPYPCNTCGQNFKTKQSLLDHQNRHLGVKPYICEICGRGFITKGLCKSHQKIHSGMDNRQYPCEVCNKMFVSKSYLNTHLRIHTGEKPYLCEVCGKGFLTRVDLKIHSTMHTGEKSFKCEMCNKIFARRAALRCHRRSHTGERPYRCDVCGKTFTQFSPMAIHKRLHTGERPYVCDICGKAFVSRSTMMCHKKKHHVTTANVQGEEEEEEEEEEANGNNNTMLPQETNEILSITH